MTDIGKGDMVVCVDNGPNRYGMTARELTIGAVYEVEAVGLAVNMSGRVEHCCELVGIYEPCEWAAGQRSAYELNRFVKAGGRGMFNELLVVERESEDA